jgi:PLP dependent protein
VNSIDKIKADITKSFGLHNLPVIMPEVIAVSKGRSIEQVQSLIDLGHKQFAENKVQEAVDKYTTIREATTLHLIGNLQRNKAKDAVEFFDYIHSVDSTSLVDELAKAESKLGIKRQYFVQVNIGEEEQKSGCSLAELSQLYDYAKDKINVIGLMAIPPAGELASPYFALLGKLAKNLGLKELSIGMSSDYVEAALLGATYVRIGTAIFS